MPSATVFSTDDLPEAGRVGAWVETIGEAIIGLKIDPQGDDPFSAAIELYDLGPVGIHFLSISQQNVHRTAEMVSRDAPGPIFIQQVRERAMRFQQFGREFTVEPGECALIDGRHAYTMEYDGANSAVGLTLAPAWLETWLPDTGAVLPSVLRPGDGWGGVLAYSLANTSREALRAMPDGQASLLASHLGSLLALSAGEQAPGRTARSRSTLLEQLRDTVRSSSQDALLGPAEVAGRHAISVRSLHLLFADAGTSFGRELREQRLMAAARMLADARFDGLATTEIAARAGFTNASHFARLFRSRFGVSPTAMRRERAR